MEVIKGITIKQSFNGDISFTIYPDQLTASIAQLTKPFRAISKRRDKPSIKGGYTHFQLEVKQKECPEVDLQTISKNTVNS